MNRTSLRRAALPSIAVLALGLTVSACGAANEAGTSNSSSSLSGTLNGAGSTAQQAAQAAWTQGFQQANPNVTVNYKPVGSGAGVTAFMSGGATFAGSDAALDPSKGEIKAAKKHCGANPIEVPDYISPIAVGFNVPGVKSLKLDAPTIAKLFSGKIKKWNDPAIAKLNKGVKLPPLAVAPVHRSDSSGTTDNFTDYLHQAGGGAWKNAASEDWPFKTGEGADGTSGVVAAVQKGKGTIGYMDESQVGKITTASVKVGSSYVAPSASGASKALADSKVESGRGPTDLAMSINRTTTKAGAYPIALTSYLITCPKIKGSTEATTKGYLSYIVSTKGQAAAAKTAGSAPLPANLQKKAAKLINGISKG